MWRGYELWEGTIASETLTLSWVAANVRTQQIAAFSLTAFVLSCSLRLSEERTPRHTYRWRVFC